MEWNFGSNKESKIVEWIFWAKVAYMVWKLLLNIIGVWYDICSTWVMEYAIAWVLIGIYLCNGFESCIHIKFIDIVRCIDCATLA
jgi:hypothetical protein